MTKISDDAMFRYAAATYLRAWIVLDSRFVHAFNHALTTDIVAELLREYKVIRNFRKLDKKDGNERFQHFVDVLARVREQYAGASALDAVSVVAQINSEIIPGYNSGKHKNFVSSASKTAWMLFRHPIAIYDRLSCDALQSLKYDFAYGDYESYYRAWTQFRADKNANIEAASKWIASSDYARRLVAHGAATLREIQGWADTDWFRNRICDQRLVWFGSHDALPKADLAALISQHELA
jgi:hypothetical protein